MWIIVDNHNVEVVDQHFKLITFNTKEDAESFLELLNCNHEKFFVKNSTN